MTHVSDERNPKTEDEEAETDGEESAVLEEGVWPVVHHTGHQGLHVAELAVHSQYLSDGLGIKIKQDVQSTSSMMKKIAAQKNDAGRERTNSG